MLKDNKKNMPKYVYSNNTGRENVTVDEVLETCLKCRDQAKWLAYQCQGVWCGAFSFLGAMVLFSTLSILSVNAMFSILSVNSFGSILSVNSAFAIGCVNTAFEICFR